jgi:patatin-like phospholipase/acyl hydrolase
MEYLMNMTKEDTSINYYFIEQLEDGQSAIRISTVRITDDNWEEAEQDYDNFEPRVFQELPEPNTNVNLNYSYDITNFPEGTLIKVLNEYQEETKITDLSSPLVFIDPGKYTISVYPPLTHKAFRKEIEVIDA